MPRTRRSLLFFGYFTFLTFLTFLANFFHLPIVLYVNSRLNFSVDNNTMIFGFKTLGMVLALFLAGRAVDRIGTKRIFLFSHLLLCVVAFATVAPGVSGSAHAQIITVGILLGGNRCIGEPCRHRPGFSPCPRGGPRMNGTAEPVHYEPEDAIPARTPKFRLQH